MTFVQIGHLAEAIPQGPYPLLAFIGKLMLHMYLVKYTGPRSPAELTLRVQAVRLQTDTTGNLSAAYDSQKTQAFPPLCRADKRLIWTSQDSPDPSSFPRLLCNQ